MRHCTMVTCAGFALLLTLASAAPAQAQQEPPPPDDNPNQNVKYVFPFEPLPPDEAPYLFLIDQFTLPHQWPLPWPRFRIRRSSGYVPGPCRELLDDPDGAVLDCWLERNPTIADAIVWEFTPMRYTRWRFWTGAHKEDLRKAFVAARRWKAAGFASPWPGDFFVDPAANQELPHLAPGEIVTVLSFHDAWKRYLSNVAVSLASEIDAWVPWSLRDYTREMLLNMFDGHLQYNLDRDDGGPFDTVFPGYYARAMTPAHAATIYRFLHDEGLIGSSPLETIERVLTWSRDHMLHSFAMTLADGTRVSNRVGSETFWGYSGVAPVSEMIRGKEAYHPTLGLVYPGIWHWTYGCAGTTRFLRNVLTVVNIPVQEVLSRRTCGHSIAYFPGEGRYLSHSDDPYSQLIKTSVFGGDRLLVTSRTWNRWFPVADEATACMSVGRRVIDLNVLIPSEKLVETHCSDQIAGNSHADSQVLAIMHGLYSEADLDRRGFWARLDMAAETSSAEQCVLWRATR